MNLAPNLQLTLVILTIFSLCFTCIAIIWLTQRQRSAKNDYLALSQNYDHLYQQFDELNFSKKHLEERLTVSLSQVEEKNQQISVLTHQSYQEKLAYEHQLSLQKQQLAQSQYELSSIKAKWQDFELNMQEKIQFYQENETRLATQFESLANRITTLSQARLNEHNQQNLATILSPLKTQIDQFNQQLQTGLSNEAKERFALKQEIMQLQQLNQRLSDEALNLTKALKSDNKIQGNWGEMILANLLDAVGFTEGREYTTQRSFLDEDNQKWIPDVIVNLPEGRHVIIDSKVSLVAYERYFNAADKTESIQAIEDLVISIRQHMKGLSQKHYQSITELNTLDYVLLFIPIEPAFLLALSQADNLLQEAQKMNIMIVSPSTLLVALRTIQQLWRSEYKNEHANLIALRAARLYDKFRLFLDDLLLIGQQINKSEQIYQAALSKLTHGRGNLIKQVESFRELGVDVKKPISDNWLAMQAAGEDDFDLPVQNQVYDDENE